MRTVCKTWNKLIGTPSFHDLCDANGENKVYLFIWREYWCMYQGIPLERQILEIEFSFLDLDARRWYSIQATELPGVCVGDNEMNNEIDDKIHTLFMAMNDGLVCTLTASSNMGSRSNDSNYAITIFDPVAKTRRTLPAPPECYSINNFGQLLPAIFTAVDDATRSYKVFLFNNLYQALRSRTQPRVYVHESCTNEWRGLKILPKEAEKLGAFSPVVLNQTVFVAMQAVLHDSGHQEVSIFNHKLQEDAWRKVWRMGFRRVVQEPQLVVSGNRFFLDVWVEPLSHGQCRSEKSYRPSESLFQTNQDYPEELFEMYEILIAENSRKPLVQLTGAQLRQIFGDHDSEHISVTYAFPLFDSNEICNSVVLVEYHTGRLRTYELATGSVGVLPPHPLMQPLEVQPIPTADNSVNALQADLYSYSTAYQAKTMKLSFRNLLAQR